MKKKTIPTDSEAKRDVEPNGNSALNCFSRLQTRNETPFFFVFANKQFFPPKKNSLNEFRLLGLSIFGGSVVTGFEGTDDGEIIELRRAPHGTDRGTEFATLPDHLYFSKKTSFPK